MRLLSFRAALFTSGLLLSFSGSPAADDMFTPLAAIRTVSGEPEIVFRHQTDACRPWMFPDAPARAFIDDSDKVVLYAADSSNWHMVGNNLDQLTTVCRSAYASKTNADAMAFDSAGWIEATYTKDGKRVLGLVSNDWSPSKETPANEATTCARSPAAKSCHYMSINFVVSQDGGQTFSYATDTQHLLAAKPLSKLSDAHPMIGFAVASNVFERGGFTYVFLGSRSPVPALSGSCLFRSAEPFRLLSWQYWNGTSFAAVANQSGGLFGILSDSHNCRPVAVPYPQPVEFRSVVRFDGCGCYIGMFEGAANQTPGFYVTTSRDLLRWSEPKIVLHRPKDSDCQDILVYPSILDPASKTRNFSDVTSSPYLYFTRFNRAACKGTVDRDLVRVRLAVSKSS